jgi:hypothetical protein
MAMTIGTVSVDSEGGYTGSGLTKRMLDEVMATPGLASALGTDGMSDAQKAELVQGMADFCEALSTAIIEEIQTNAEVTVTVGTGDAGIQRMPATLTEDTPTKAPGSPVVLGTKGTVE